MSKDDKAAKPAEPEAPKVAGDAAPVPATQPDPKKAAEPVSEVNPNIPTASLTISNNEKANDEILAFAKKLEKAGDRAFFEVHYDLGEGVSDADSFDAVEVIDGKIYTLPPYSELGDDSDVEGQG